LKLENILHLIAVSRYLHSDISASTGNGRLKDPAAYVVG